MSTSYLASGTLKSVLSFCLALSTIIAPVLSAPTISETSQPWTPRSLKSVLEPRAAACDGVGILLTNQGASKSFSFWTNNEDDSRSLLKSVSVQSDSTVFVPLSSGWAGTVQRGDVLPATWVEMNFDATTGIAWGDVSLQQGCDGGATLASTTDGTSQGFSENINENADVPTAAFYNPDTETGNFRKRGTPQGMTTERNVLDTTTGNWWIPAPGNTASTDYITETLGGETEAKQKAFVGDDVNTTPQVTSSNQCLAVTFY